MTATFEDQSPEDALRSFMAQTAEQQAADKARIARLEADNERIRAEAAARDKAYLERLAAQGKTPGEAVTSLAGVYSAKPQEQRNAITEELDFLACNLFGPKSDSAAANRLALSDIRKYRAVKARAHLLGRI